MQVSGWCNGRQGYGIRISRADRDAHFKRHWKSVTLLLSDIELEVAITPSFWRGCSELRSKEIGQWFRNQELVPWAKGKPPKFELEPEGEAVFRLIRPD